MVAESIRRELLESALRSCYESPFFLTLSAQRRRKRNSPTSTILTASILTLSSKPGGCESWHALNVTKRNSFAVTRNGKR
jgi:hypothetical protein